jgi:hypothetical protein
MTKHSSKGNSQIEPPLGHLPLMAGIEFDPVRPVCLSETVPNVARLDAPGQMGMGINGLADRLDAAVKRAADGPPLGPPGSTPRRPRQPGP